MKKFIIKFILITAFMLSASMSLQPLANALTFNPNNIMDDLIFSDYNSMSVNQIDSFLNSFTNSCISSKNGFVTPNPLGWSEVQQKYLYGSNVTAGAAIHSAAALYHVNPRVILATMQKEQSLVSGSAGCHPNIPNPSWPSSPSPAPGKTFTCTISGKSQSCTYACTYAGGCMNIAVGYGCPYYCATAHEGFSKQLTLGTWLLRFGQQRSLGNLTGYAGYETGDESFTYNGPMTPGNRKRSINSQEIYYNGSYTTSNNVTLMIKNGATATLYNFTPYTSGNQNFFNIYVGWWGSTSSNCVYPTDNLGNVYRVTNLNNSSQLITTSAREVCITTGSMNYKYDSVVFDGSGTGSDPVYRLEQNGNYLFTASEAERVYAINSYGFKLDGVAFSASKIYNATSSPLGVHRVANTQSGGYIYTPSQEEVNYLTKSAIYRDEGIIFYTKNSAGQTLSDIYRLANSNGYLLSPLLSEKESAVKYYGYRYEGVAFQSNTGYSSNNVPVYRLARTTGYLFTTSLSERARAVKLGFRNEGITFFAYPAYNLGATKPVYRLSSPGGVYLYTTSLSERDNAVAKYGYRYEGIGFRVP